MIMPPLPWGVFHISNEKGISRETWEEKEKKTRKQILAHSL